MTHYFSHAAWLDEDELLRNATAWPASRACCSMAGSICPVRRTSPGRCAQAWPGSELHFIPGGHTGDAEMDRRLLEALDRFGG